MEVGYIDDRQAPGSAQELDIRALPTSWTLDQADAAAGIAETAATARVFLVTPFINSLPILNTCGNNSFKRIKCIT